MTVTDDEATAVPASAVSMGGGGTGSAASAPKRKAGAGIARFAGPAGALVGFFAMWYFVHYVLMSDNRKFLVPPPHTVINESILTWNIPRGEGGTRTGGGLFKLLEGLWSSFQVAALGLGIAITLGLVLATLMSQAKWIENAIYPYLVAIQAMPILAFVPLIGLVLGFDFWSRVLVCVIIAIFPIVANTLFGLVSVDRGYHELMTLNGASRWTRLRKLQFPAAMPSIFTGLQISAGLSVVGAVVGDFFFRQGEPGIGRLINTYQAASEESQLYGAVIVTAVFGISVFLFFGWLGRRVVGHWHETRSS
ncbi:ABC transporter permease [Ilumatobacter coccineus]|uniref:Putative ABC transporter permease protein n=1 Tax=Ilumatobacter coccineus (strain NBRC 103263 / KCTC 29153 / YM16-304) TaxID=1313172 RepID=A0A6C7ECJ7_ILUCY|nr:ABC transporter permease [Ilumatobacter coccineus]BAN02855.1 putative ABC transporter permease protein [Ilumatobacter coccineus YM16-304]